MGFSLLSRESARAKVGVLATPRPPSEPRSMSPPMSTTLPLRVGYERTLMYCSNQAHQPTSSCVRELALLTSMVSEPLREREGLSSEPLTRVGEAGK